VPRTLRALHGLLAEGKVPLLREAAVGIVVIALAGGLFSYFQIFITSSIGYKMVYALRRELFTHLQTLSLAFHNRARSGDLLTKIAGDTNTLKDVFADSILKFSSYVLTGVGMLAIMAATRSSEIITALGTAAAVLFGAFQVLKGRMLPGELVLVVGYLTNMYKPIRQLAKLSTDFSKAMAAAERVSEVLDIEPEITDRPDAVPATGLKGEIEFRDVSFDYGDGKDVLRNVSFSVS